jgi:hypothetical protein
MLVVLVLLLLLARILHQHPALLRKVNRLFKARLSRLDS